MLAGTDTSCVIRWLGNAAKQLESEGFDAALCVSCAVMWEIDELANAYTPCSAYEEAIGYMVSKDIRDKDGVSLLPVNHGRLS